MSLRGANVTLLDYSEVALKRAKELYNFFDLEPNTVKADIFNLNSQFLMKFDISLSFGLVEHFLESSERQEAMNAHFKVLKKGGISFISVPNKLCPHYLLRHLTVSYLGLSIHKEEPFTKKELIECAKQAGFKRYEVFGSSLFDLSYLTDYYGEFKTVFDNYFAYAIVLFAIK